MGTRSVTIPEAMHVAFELHEAGNLAKAERIYRQILEVEPNHADALHLLGIIGLQTGDLGSAREAIERAVDIEPSNTYFLNSLGNVYLKLNRDTDAQSCFERAVALFPENFEASNNLAAVLKRRGRFDEAERSCRQALAVNPDYAEAHNNLGNTLFEMGRLEEAEQSIDRALALKPDYAEAKNNLGNVLWKLGRSQQAENCYREALALRPEYAEAHNNLGNALFDMGRLDEAEQCYRQAFALKPDYARAHCNLGHTLLKLQRVEEAERHCRRALEISPDYAEAECNLGLVLSQTGRLDEAQSCYRRALALKPDFVDAHYNLIFVLDLMESGSTREQQEERRRWYAQHGRTYADSAVPHDNSADPERKLRIGYVSADFHLHSAYFIFAPIIRLHDRSGCEVICYSGVKNEDDCTVAIREPADSWRSTLGLSDESLAEQIRRDRVDILVDLSGHSAGNRLLTFARKPAPVQITAWGYATGTGMQTMDYFFADPVLVPQDERGHFSEEVVDLPCCVCYEAPGYAPPPSPLPSAAGKPFTFGCLNRIEKISGRSFRLWARILGAVPGSRILIKDSRIDDAGIREQLLRRLAGHGIGGERVCLLGNSPHAEHLGNYAEVDLALDPYPHGGGVSSMEALWMGVPVVTLMGSTVPGRLSASILTALGAPEWIARTDEEYVQTAVNLASDRARLSRVREQLRPRMLKSIVGDVRRYTDSVERIYRSLWRRWCARSAR